MRIVFDTLPTLETPKTMHGNLKVLLILLLLISFIDSRTEAQIQTGASRTQEYTPFLKGRKVGLVVNSGSRIGNQYLPDSLLKMGIQVKKIFAPEHGFRQSKDAGQAFGNFTDSTTQVPVISLYGKHVQPDSTDLADLDMVIFDLQDVGVRFYTYISTLHYVMKACAHWGKPLIILDRPNPNGAYVQGPVLDTAFRSFIGMHPVPVLYGMTIGEYARMVKGENWIHESKPIRLEIISLGHYRHDLPYSLPYPPSPNLPNDLSIILYPSLCLFEGTQISIGRGTEFPFQVFGSPDMNAGNFIFTPHSIEGKSTHPLLENQNCRGYDLRKKGELNSGPIGGFSLKYILLAYSEYKGKSPFFVPFFNKLAGNNILRSQIENGMSEKEIRSSWKPELEKFLAIREKYLLYP
jgi:uncharacterized protein YbbC (DUF1343 family)